MGSWVFLEKKNLWADFWQAHQQQRHWEREKTRRSIQKAMKSVKHAMSPALFSQSNLSSDSTQNFCQYISPVLICIWKEEGKAAALDRAAQFTGFLQEAAPWLWAELADSEPVLQSSQSSTLTPPCIGNLDSSHGWREKAVQLKSSGKWRRWVMLSNSAILLQFAFSKV